MSDKTEISWTDSTFNPWIGCTKVSPACDHCYAEALMDTRHHRVKWGAGQPRSRTSSANWKLPLRWNKEMFWECPDCRERAAGVAWGKQKAGGCDHLNAVPARRRVFSASLADWLDNEVPIEWLVDFLDLIRRTPNLDWLLLTKRIGNWRSRIGSALNASNSVELREWLALWLNGDVPRNVWAGSTVIDQPELDRDYRKLMSVPATKRFLSIEPMLAEVDLSFALDVRLKQHGAGKPAWYETSQHASGRYVDWVIAGGESGPGARPVKVEWARMLRDQCAAAGVAFHWKQWGEWVTEDQAPMDIVLPGQCTMPWAVKDAEGQFTKGDQTSVWKVSKKAAGRLLDGVTHDGFPS